MNIQLLYDMVSPKFSHVQYNPFAYSGLNCMYIEVLAFRLQILAKVGRCWLLC